MASRSSETCRFSTCYSSVTSCFSSTVQKNTYLTPKLATMAPPFSYPYSIEGYD